MNKQKIPRIMIAGTSSGSGKTTVTCGILQSLVNKKIKTASFKCGPDYVDSMFHQKVIGVKSSNLDLFLLDKKTCRYLLYNNMECMDIAIIEGVMGYYDGIGGNSTDASSFDIANQTNTPTILVVNCKGMSMSIIPQIKGYLDYKNSNICGVILNNISQMLYTKIKDLIENELNIKVFGYLPTMKNCEIGSRKLGLISANEIENIQQIIQQISVQCDKTINIDLIIETANNADKIDIDIPEIISNNYDIKKVKPTVAVALDNCFCFYYKDNINLLERLCKKVIYFSPIADNQIPSEVDGVIFGGGYIEVYAKELSKNFKMIKDIKKKLYSGMPCFAEDAGFVYLNKSFKLSENQVYDFVGVLEGITTSQDKLCRFGYTKLTSLKGNIMCDEGDKINAHEFHYMDTNLCGDSFISQKPNNKKKWNCIYTNDNIFAGYPHLHFYSNPNFILNFINKCNEYRNKR